MGLDQYLSVRKYVSRNEQAFDNTVITNDMWELVEKDGYTGAFIEIPVMYWRKFNALHKHIVDTWADGRDECQPIELPVDGLRTIHEKLSAVLKEPSRAREILPTEDGFFFGDTEYNEWYFEQVTQSHEELGELLSKLDKRTDDLYPIYQASW